LPSKDETQQRDPANPAGTFCYVTSVSPGRLEKSLESDAHWQLRSYTRTPFPLDCTSKKVASQEPGKILQDFPSFPKWVL